MKQLLLVLSFFFSNLDLTAQEVKFRDNIDKDSLFEVSVKRLPVPMRAEYIKAYKEGALQEKELLLFMISLPSSSKTELIDNYENKKTEILKLRTEFRKHVPEGHIVEIEFEPESKIVTTPEQITIKIYKKRNIDKKVAGDNKIVHPTDDLIVVSQNWNLLPDSPELKLILKSLNWTSHTLAEIKKLLVAANCVSIENGEITTVGFARSGLGKYSYKIFNKTLSSQQMKDYDNGCAYIYYRDNIVLEYGGGAIGPQCFEKE